jgi:hypothetical protein
MVKFRVLTAIIIFLLLPGVAFADSAQPRALPTTHFMTYNMQVLSPESAATSGSIAGIVTKPQTVVQFKTFDQFTCNAGNYELLLRIIRTDNNTVVAATKPIAFTAPMHASIYSQPAEWQVLFPVIGWYRYEVLINGQAVAFYYFIVSFSI